jgi:hypothetical protein
MRHRSQQATAQWKWTNLQRFSSIAGG